MTELPPFSNLTPITKKPRRSDPARRAIKVYRGPFATVYACPFCKHTEVVKRLPRLMAGKIGRGFGLRTGGTAHSKVGAHIRKEHKDKLEGN